MKNGLYSLLIFTCLTSGCNLNTNQASKENITYPVVSVITKNATLSKEYIADIEATKNVEIRTKVSGFLDKIYVDEGQEVKKGQQLFKIDDAEYKTELAKAKANVSMAISEAHALELEVERLKLLVNNKVISGSELEMSKAKLLAAKSRIDEAKSELLSAEIKLSHSTIKAPFDGIIDRIPLKAGSLIDQGALLTTLSDVKKVYTYFNMSEVEYLEYLKLKKLPSYQPKLELMLADGSIYQHQGTIETLQGEFQQEMGTISFRACFPNPEKILKHGLTGKVILRNTIDQANLIPQKCVFEIQDKNYVYTVDKQNKVHIKSFVPEGRFGNYYLIKSGLAKGSNVVYEGHQDLTEGKKIIPQMIVSDAPLN